MAQRRVAEKVSEPMAWLICPSRLRARLCQFRVEEDPAPLAREIERRGSARASGKKNLKARMPDMPSLEAMGADCFGEETGHLGRVPELAPTSSTSEAAARDTNDPIFKRRLNF